MAGTMAMATETAGLSKRAQKRALKFAQKRQSMLETKRARKAAAKERKRENKKLQKGDGGGGDETEPAVGLRAMQDGKPFVSSKAAR